MRIKSQKAVGLLHQMFREMNNAIVSSLMIHDYEERRDALCRDGYRLRHETYFDDGVLCRLHHMCNGNDITLTARANCLVQKTNHVVVHRQFYVKT